MNVKHFDLNRNKLCSICYHTDLIVIDFVVVGKVEVVEFYIIFLVHLQIYLKFIFLYQYHKMFFK